MNNDNRNNNNDRSTSLTEEQVEALNSRTKYMKECTYLTNKNGGACFRLPKNIRPADAAVTEVSVRVLMCVAISSLLKCPEARSNKQRVFVVGDTMDIVLPPDVDTGTYNERVWVVVARAGLEEKKYELWKRNLQDVLSCVRVSEDTWRRCPVRYRGAVKRDAHKSVSVLIPCLCVSVTPNQKMWMEEEKMCYAAKQQRSVPTTIPTEVMDSSRRGIKEEQQQQQQQQQQYDDEGFTRIYIPPLFSPQPPPPPPPPLPLSTMTPQMGIFMQQQQQPQPQPQPQPVCNYQDNKFCTYYPTTVPLGGTPVLVPFLGDCSQACLANTWTGYLL